MTIAVLFFFCKRDRESASTCWDDYNCERGLAFVVEVAAARFPRIDVNTNCTVVYLFVTAGSQ